MPETQRRTPPRLLPAWSLVLALCANLAEPYAAEANAFDYWVLSLDWAPETCAALRGTPQAATCEPQRGLVLQGLWPQRESGPLADCPPAGEPLPAALVERLAPRLPQAERVWQAHGRCSGLTPEEYFANTEQARVRVQPPDKFLRGRANQRISKTQLEKAFLDVNPGLLAEALTIECRSHYLTEIRVCLDRALQPRACGAEVGDVCERELIIRPQGH